MQKYSKIVFILDSFCGPFNFKLGARVRPRKAYIWKHTRKSGRFAFTMENIRENCIGIDYPLYSQLSQCKTRYKRHDDGVRKCIGKEQRV